MKLETHEVRAMADFLSRVHKLEGDMSIRRLETLLEVYLQQPETSIPKVIKSTGIEPSNMTKILQSWAHRNQFKKKGPGYISIKPDPMNLRTRIIEVTGHGIRAVHRLFNSTGTGEGNNAEPAHDTAREST